MKNELLPSQKHPQIYIFTTQNYKNKNWEGVKKGRGLLKVGYTEQLNVLNRIDQQFPTKTPEITPYELIFKTTAIDESGIIFKDFAIHKRLRELGFRHVNGEWFECTKEDVISAIHEIKAGKKFISRRYQNFGCRPEQLNAVELTQCYFQKYPGKVNAPSHFLWNAKMRFGKTFTSYQLAKKMNWQRVLVLTYKPATVSQWREDLESHLDFENWKFFSPGEKYDPKEQCHYHVFFASFQDILGKTADKKSTKERFKHVFETEWDIAFIDEYHFGAWRDAAKELYDSDPDKTSEPSLGFISESALPLKVSHLVYLSGTPFRAIANGEFTEDQIFNWTYSDEQNAKAEFGNLVGNPYSDLPKMVLMTYQLPEKLREIAMEGETNEFDLNEFFRAKKLETSNRGKEKYQFIHEDQVNQWLGLLRGQLTPGINAASFSESDTQAWPYKSAALQTYLTHTFWFMPSVASCYAMADLLSKKGSFYSSYKIVVAAGNEAGMGEKALEPVKDAIGPNPLTSISITLSCGKLSMGVSVPAWSGIFILRNTTSPETYFQAAFRVQTPWSYISENGSSAKVVIKPICYVFDFAPTRALRLISEYSSRLDLKSTSSVTDKVEEFLKFLPVLCYDGSNMQELNATELLDYATVGTASSMLARRWQSDYLVNLDSFTIQRLLDRPDLIAALSKIEGFRNLSNLKSRLVKMINHEAALNKVKKDNRKITEELTKEQKEVRQFRKEIQRDLKKFITRIPVFMYLTDYREERLIDVIRCIEPDLFTTVTGLEITDFEKLNEVGIFNSALMNQAVFAFKRFEEASLSYAGGISLSNYAGGFDTVVKREDLKKMTDG